jgi:ABC-2 type transport system permease protein
LTKLDPVYYMIGLVRYGFLGAAGINVALSLLFLTGAAAAIFALNYRMFLTGSRLRA